MRYVYYASPASCTTPMVGFGLQMCEKGRRRAVSESRPSRRRRPLPLATDWWIYAAPAQGNTIPMERFAGVA